MTDMGAVGSGEGEEADADVGVTTEQEEVLTLVCGDDPPAVAGFASKVGVRPEGISDHEHLASLNARREALKFVLSGTLTNLMATDADKLGRWSWTLFFASQWTFAVASLPAVAFCMSALPASSGRGL